MIPVERALAIVLAEARPLPYETTPLDDTDRWWVYKCPTAGCAGLLHVAGYARDSHAV